MPVTDVADITGVPAILGHRVVTLHPKVHGGILADPDDPDHRRDLEEHGIEPIDLVVVNLYPFASDPSVDLIDIGGPAMVPRRGQEPRPRRRVVDPADYQAVLDELRAGGRLAAATRRRLARTAFARTAAYDAQIVAWLDAQDGPAEPATARLPADPDAAARAGPGVAVRGEPAPGRRPVPPRRVVRLVGPRRPARRQGAQLPQPLRRRSGVAARPALRRAGLRDRQARQPVRRRRRSRTSPRPTSWRTPAIRSAPSAASSPSTGRCPPPRPRPWRRCSPRSSWRPATTMRRWRS